MGGGDSSGTSTTTIRYAPYIEAHHQTLLSASQEIFSATAYEAPAEHLTPFKYNGEFSNYTDVIDYETAFFSLGYGLVDFPSLWDMYGKFMAGLDIDVLFTQIFDDTINNVAINNRVSAHAEELSDDLEEIAFPRLATGLRDINSVISSSFAVAKGMLEVQRQRTLSRYDATLRHSAMPLATERWTRHLEWNKAVPVTYKEFIQFYFNTKIDIDSHYMELEAKSRLWVYTVLEYYKNAVGTLHGAQTSKSEIAGSEPNKTQKAVGGAVSGAAAGAMITPGNPAGVIIGGLIGLGAGLL